MVERKAKIKIGRCCKWIHKQHWTEIQIKIYSRVYIDLLFHDKQWIVDKKFSNAIVTKWIKEWERLIQAVIKWHMEIKSLC